MGSSIVKSMCIFLVMAVAVIAIARKSEAAIGCETVVSSIGTCLTYLTGNGPVLESCCNGIRSLDSAAATTLDRQSVCKCLKSTAASISGINLDNAARLPGQCGVNLPYKISPSTDCSKVV